MAHPPHGVGRLLPTQSNGFPWSTFLVNVSGALLLCILVVLLQERFPPNRYARAFLGTGFLGAYTTFSTYTVETVLLGQERIEAFLGELDEILADGLVIVDNVTVVQYSGRKPPAVQP